MKREFFLTFLFVRAVSWGETGIPSQKHSLVDIFCTTVSEKIRFPEKFSDTQKVWTSLEEKLQRGELFSIVYEQHETEEEFQKVKNTSIFQNCIEQHRKEFELGEFILNGRKIVRESLDAYRINRANQISTVSLSLPRLLEEGTDMEFEITSSNSPDIGLKEIDAIALREKKYTQLWEQFFQELKDKVGSTRF